MGISHVTLKNIVCAVDFEHNKVNRNNLNICWNLFGIEYWFWQEHRDICGIMLNSLFNTNNESEIIGICIIHNDMARLNLFEIEYWFTIPTIIYRYT